MYPLLRRTRAVETMKLKLRAAIHRWCGNILIQPNVTCPSGPVNWAELASVVSAPKPPPCVAIRI
jgi:hypothetical protein